MGQTTSRFSPVSYFAPRFGQISWYAEPSQDFSASTIFVGNDKTHPLDAPVIIENIRIGQKGLTGTNILAIVLRLGDDKKSFKTFDTLGKCYKTFYGRNYELSY